VGQASLAFGSNAVSSAVDSTAIGGAALAQGDASIAVGRGAAATTSNATALGRSAVAAHVNATAIGAGAQATAANQIRLGTTSNIYSLPGLLTASDAAQTGPEFFVTIDSNGTLGKGAQSSAALSQMGSQIAALQQGQALIDDQVASLFNLRTLDRKQNQRGIAAAMAMADAPFPSAPGKTSYAAKTGVYRGEVAVSASFSHRLNTGSPFALTASVSHSGGKDTGFTAGLAGEF
jgi:autotransporter adhesin